MTLSTIRTLTPGRLAALCDCSAAKPQVAFWQPARHAVGVDAFCDRDKIECPYRQKCQQIRPFSCTKLEEAKDAGSRARERASRRMRPTACKGERALWLVQFGRLPCERTRAPWRMWPAACKGDRGSKPRPPRSSSVVEDWWDPVRGGQRGLARGKRSCCAARLRSGRIGRPSCAEIGRKALPFRGLDAPGPRQAGCLAAFAQPARRGQGPCRPPLPGKCVQIGEGRPQRAILPARSPPDASRPCSRSADPAAAGGRGSGGRERREAGRGREKGTVPFSRWPEGRRSTAA